MRSAVARPSKLTAPWTRTMRVSVVAVIAVVLAAVSAITPAAARAAKPAKPQPHAKKKSADDKQAPASRGKAPTVAGSARNPRVSAPSDKTRKNGAREAVTRLVDRKQEAKGKAKQAGSARSTAKAKTGRREATKVVGRSGHRGARHTRVLARAGARQAPCREPSRLADRPSLPDPPDMPNLDASPVLTVASRLLGRRYRFGAMGDAYYDCSGLVRSVFLEFGVDLPHSAREQFAMGGHVDRDELEPGDLVFFETYRPGASHVGIYAGEDRFIHASSGVGRVKVSSLHQGYYARRYLGARRIAI